MAQTLPTLIGRSVSLKPAQEIVLASLEERGADELVRSDYEEISGVSRSQAAYDIAELVSLGILERIGSGRATRYRLPSSGAGRPKKWTEGRIRSQLREFHADVGRWPRAADFRESGRSDLYVAACRNGGIERWARELAPHEIVHETSARPADSRVWLSHALFLALCLGVLTLVGPPHRDLGAAPSPRAARFDDAKIAARKAKAQLEALGATKAELVLTARDDVDITVRRGSATGRMVFGGLLVRGASVRAAAKKFWVEIASPAALAARLDGRVLRLPSRPVVLVITSEGIRSVQPRPPKIRANAATAPEATATAATAPPPATTASATTSPTSPDDQPSPDAPPSRPGPDPKPSP